MRLCPNLYLDCFPRPITKYALMRRSIFCIISMCAGYPALIWAVSALHHDHHHHKSKGRISFISIFLLLSDLLELMLNPTLVALTLSGFEYSPKWTLEVVCFMLYVTRLCGHLFHALVVFNSILTQKYPSLTFFPSALQSLISCIILLVVIIGCQFMPQFIPNEINFLFLVLSLLIYVATYVMACKTSPNTNQTTSGKPGVLILSVATFTLIILYVPFFLSCYISVPFTSDLLVYMRVISEPLLCVLVCREKHFVTKQ